MSLPAPSSRSSTSAAQEAHPPQALAWHALSAADCLARLDVPLSEGLSAADEHARHLAIRAESKRVPVRRVGHKRGRAERTMDARS